MKRPVSGRKRVQCIEQGTTSTLILEGNEDLLEDLQESGCRHCVDESDASLPAPDTGNEEVEPTSYELESIAYAAGWAAVQDGIQAAVTESAAMPLSLMCITVDCSNSASLRCQSRGPLVFFCENCFFRCHSLLNIFHVPEKWEV